jgi:Bacterial regulatory proteins, tetR family
VLRGSSITRGEERVILFTGDFHSLDRSCKMKYDVHHMREVKAGSKKEQTRERILRAAARAIRKHGYEGVGVADVMREAGLTSRRASSRSRTCRALSPAPSRGRS